MSKSIKLTNDTYWDSSSVQYKVYSARISGDTFSYNVEQNLKYSTVILNTTNGLVSIASDGTITINYDGYVEFNINVWFGSTNSEKTFPWLTLHDVTNNKDLANTILGQNDNFVNLSLSNFAISNKKGTKYKFSCHCQCESRVDHGSGRSLSYITIKLY